jgi:hypothetical protein
MTRVVAVVLFSSVCSACGRGATSNAPGSILRAHDDSLSASATTTDPIVAHFFNTATIANDEAAVIAATQDGGPNADAGE